jgi:hypothetical protein
MYPLGIPKPAKGSSIPLPGSGSRTLTYPLGPFPPEILSNIVRLGNEPSLYRSLSLTSPRIREAIRPALETICEAPIRLNELISYIDTLPEFRYNRYTYITLLRYNPEFPEYVSLFVDPFGDRSIEPATRIPDPSERRLSYYSGGSSVSKELYNYFRERNRELPIRATLEILWNQGFQWITDLADLRGIYERRRSCVHRIPNYPIVAILGELKRRRSVQAQYLGPYFRKEIRTLSESPFEIEELSLARITGFGREFNDLYNALSFGMERANPDLPNDLIRYYVGRETLIILQKMIRGSAPG